MNKEDTRKAVEQAYDDGAEIEMRRRNGQVWYLRGPFKKTPSTWNWEQYEYRIKVPKTKDSQAQYVQGEE